MLYKYDGTPYRSAYTRNGRKAKRATAATLDEAGETILASTKSLCESYDPDGTALKFVVVTDLHRSEDGVYVENSIDDRYTLRLLSRLCDEVDFDAVFCGGDITNARDQNAEYYQKNMADVVSDFDSYIPYTPIYSTVGNHDKRYSTSRPNITNAQLRSLWSPVCANGNGAELHYVDDTNFYVDFVRHKVRIIFINQYDRVDENANWYANENLSSTTGIHTRGSTNWKAALPTNDKAEWLVGVVFHGADNSVPTNPNITAFTYTALSDTLQAYVDGGGRGALGAISGHYHTKKTGTVMGSLNITHILNGYASESQVGTSSAYSLSVIIVNSDTGVWHEFRRGRASQRIPFCAYYGSRGNNGLLQNGTRSVDNSHTTYFCCYNGNHVRLDSVYRSYGMNYTNHEKNWGYSANDFVTSDTDNVLFSAQAGDVIKTEIIFSDDSASTPSPIKIFSPQIADMVVVPKGEIAGQTITNEITLSEDTDVTAVGMNNYSGTAPSGILDFELNIYKNGVKLVRQS